MIDLLYIRDEETHPDGTVIFEEGGFSDWVYVIMEGEVKVSKNTPNVDCGVMGFARLTGLERPASE